MTPTIKEILHTADGIGDKPMQMDTDAEYHGDEIHELLDLVQADGSIHDLDQYEEDAMHSVLGSVLCGVLKRLEALEQQASSAAMWLNEDGSPCDGFRFREEMLKLRDMLPKADSGTSVR